MRRGSAMSRSLRFRRRASAFACSRFCAARSKSARSGSTARVYASSLTSVDARIGRTSAKGDAAKEAAPADSEAMELPTIAGLSITDAAVTLEDRGAKTRRVVRDFSLETGRLASGEPFDLKTGFVLDQEPSSSIEVHLAAAVTADLERNTHRLAKPEIDVTFSGQGYPAEGVPVQVRAETLEADIGQELYGLDGLTVTTTWKGDGFPLRACR